MYDNTIIDIACTLKMIIKIILKKTKLNWILFSFKFKDLILRENIGNSEIKRIEKNMQPIIKK